jgi:DNA-directed RNA polymerase alpha subunit
MKSDVKRVTLKTSVATLHFSARINRVFAEYMVKTVADITSRTRIQFLQMRGLGEISVKEIETTINSYAFFFRKK